MHNLRIPYHYRLKATDLLASIRNDISKELFRCFSRCWLKRFSYLCLNSYLKLTFWRLDSLCALTAHKHLSMALSVLIRRRCAQMAWFHDGWGSWELEWDWSDYANRSDRFSQMISCNGASFQSAILLLANYWLITHSERAASHLRLHAHQTCISAQDS